jgi:hypothetical protein
MRVWIGGDSTGILTEAWMGHCCGADAGRHGESVPDSKYAKSQTAYRTFPSRSERARVCVGLARATGPMHRVLSGDRKIYLY